MDHFPAPTEVKMVQAMFTQYVKRNDVWKCRESKEIFHVLLVKPRPPCKVATRARPRVRTVPPPHGSTARETETEPASRVESGGRNFSPKQTASTSAQSCPSHLLFIVLF